VLSFFADTPLSCCASAAAAAAGARGAARHRGRAGRRRGLQRSRGHVARAQLPAHAAAAARRETGVNSQQRQLS